MQEFADALLFDSRKYSALSTLKKAKSLKLLRGKPFVVKCRLGWLVTDSPTTELYDNKGRQEFVFESYLPGIKAGFRKLKREATVVDDTSNPRIESRNSNGRE